MAFDTNPAPASVPFRHEALLYAGAQDFVDRTTEFIAGGIAAGEPTFVMVDRGKISWLRDALGSGLPGVEYADMAAIGPNPARILPVWQSFIDRHQDAPGLRGIGEPIWAGRTAAEVVECQRHEALVNLALADVDDLWLLCLYDVDSLDGAIITEARRSHPYVQRDGRSGRSADFPGHDATLVPLDAPLPDAPAGAKPVPFRRETLSHLRGHVEVWAQGHGLGPDQAADFVLAVSEIAANSVDHGGGGGALRLWSDGGDLVAEIRDDGRIDDPLVGRRVPRPDAVGGRGLWIANQLCDLVEVRSSQDGSVVRVHLRRTRPSS